LFHIPNQPKHIVQVAQSIKKIIINKKTKTKKIKKKVEKTKSRKNKK
jgi:hypothetical protein